MASKADLFDILQKYNWQIVDHNYIEIISAERENAWKDLIILALKSTPVSFRTNLRRGTLENFDFKQPIFYDLKRRELGVTNDSIINSLTPPQYATVDTGLIRPLNVVTVFIIIVLSYLTWRGVGERVLE
jgi:hypothetical protein